MHDLARPLLLSLALLLGGSAAAGTASLPPVVRLVTHDFPPFTTLEAGEPRGPARELIDRVCAELGIRCEHRLLPWPRGQKLVQLGEADGMYVIGFNPERAEWLHFSTPLLTTEYGFFVRDDDPLQYRGPTDLRGRHLAVYGPSNTARSLDRLREQGEFSVEASPDNEAGFRQLGAGRVDAVYSNREVGWAVVRRLGLAHVRYTGPDRHLKYYVGFSRRTLGPDFNQAFSDAYKRLQERGVVREVLMRYAIQP